MTPQVAIKRETDAPQRRGACPGLSAPMPTGDGLLVRLLPIGTIALDAFCGLCAAAKRHGNGTVEVTARGSVQVRGLTAASAPSFATAVATLGIAAQEGVPVLTDPLAGLAADEIFDAAAFAADLHAALAQSSLSARLSAKVSVAVDGANALDDVAADVRLRAERTGDEVILRVSVGGDAASACEIGAVAPSRGVAAAMRMLEAIARHGREARARDIIAAYGILAFRSAIGELAISARSRQGGDPKPDTRLRGKKSPLGSYRLGDGSFACGVGLAFGSAHASMLERLAEAAREAGAIGVRAAPGRALLAIGLAPAKFSPFTTAAEKLGFIVDAGDARRRVIACAGAPLCASGHIAARAMAPGIAELTAAHRDPSFTIHVSGCVKGCAHPGPAALTVVGTPDGCALIRNGSPRDAPFATAAAETLAAAIAAMIGAPLRGAGHA